MPTIDFRQQRTEKQQKNRARNRLHSIEYDYTSFVRSLLQNCNIPVVVNARAGKWFWPKTNTTESYFKSIDGHNGVHDFSLKRLNLHLLKILSKTGAFVVLDASRRRPLPDSLSKTIPIWAAVLNRIACRLQDRTNWDHHLYTGPNVSKEEHVTIRSVLDKHVQTVLDSGVLVQADLIRDLSKPIRCVWITPDSNWSWIEIDDLRASYHVVVCVSCSSLANKEKDALYSPGAADDEETWARGLIPVLFWKHRKQILHECADEDATDAVIDQIVAKAKETDCKAIYRRLGSTCVFLGSRRAGRPPQCWEHFDAVLNVTEQSYPDMSTPPEGKYYLQLPVEEGKRDRTELERWMTVGIAFVISNMRRRVLIHCAQGKDRSVAVAMAFVALFCDAEDVNLKYKYGNTTIKTIACGLIDSPDDYESPKASGLHESALRRLQGREGRNLLFATYRYATNNSVNIGKEHLRVVLQAIKVFRDEAAPTRSTMKKLHRYFMSQEYQQSDV